VQFGSWRFEVCSLKFGVWRCPPGDRLSSPVTAPQKPVRALFINGGILGLKTFASFVEQAFVGDCDGVRASQIVLTSDLTLAERAARRVLCAHFWPGDATTFRNADLHRFRAEWHAGLLARRQARRPPQADRWQAQCSRRGKYVKKTCGRDANKERALFPGLPINEARS